MATYNGERFIREQIESILNQTYQNWRLLIHDDGSSDRTLDIIKRYSSKYPEKIILIEDGVKCGGAKENFAHLIEITKRGFINAYDYIMFADQDDVWLPEKIELTLEKMIYMEAKFNYTPPLLVHTDLKVVDSNLNLISESFWNFQKINPLRNSLNYLLFQNTVTGCTVMINKKLLNLLTEIPKEAIMHDYWIALIAAAFGQICPISEQTILYRIHNANNWGARKFGFKYIIERFLYEHELIKKVIYAQIKQACKFLEIYKDKLACEKIETLENFCKIEYAGFLKKRKIIIENKFFRYGFLRNIALFLML